MPAAVDDAANGFAETYGECSASIKWMGKIPDSIYDASLGANPFYTRRIGAG